MKYSIIVSRKDPAGMNIANNLINLHNFKKGNTYYSHGNITLYYTDQESIDCENIDQDVEGDILIFATKHQSAKGTNSLSVHVPGNWDKAELGGKEKTLCIAPASLVKDMFIELNKQGKDTNWEITLEAVHHGPYVKKPVMFIEIGSSKEQWKNKKAGKIIADTIINVLSKKPKEYRTFFAIGAGHYPIPFNKLLLRSDYAIGQICPKYQLENLNADLVKQAIEKNMEDVDTVVLDWKGLGQHKEKVRALLDKLEIRYEKVKNILNH